MAVVVHGLKELTRTFNNAPKDVKREYRKELRSVGEPVRVTAETLAISRIRRMFDSPQWARMRTGVTTRLVYVAPRQKGARGRGGQSLRRPNLSTLLMDRAMQPALEQNRSRIELDFDVMLDRLVRRWDADGP